MAESSHKQEVQQEITQPILPPKPNKTPHSTTTTALAFWAYLTILVSLLTLLLAFLLSLRSPDDHLSWFLALPDELRLHYSDGKLIKIHTTTASPSLVFVADFGPRNGSETVLLLHGLGCSSFSFRRVIRSLASSGGIRAVAIDLPGSGFSDPLRSDDADRGLFGRIRGIYRDIRDKGIFWGFDQLVETGQIPFDERLISQPERSGHGSAEIGRVVAQVVDSMALAPVHLVLHDSALGAGANWASMSPSSVRSVTLVDAAAESAAFPSGLLGVPVLGRVLLGSRSVFTGLLKLCCSRSIDGFAAEAYRQLLKGSGGRGIVEAGKGLNYSFDLGEWAESESVRDLPVQVLWSNTWSDVWIDEGRQVAAAVPRAKFASHSGGRWPQEDAAVGITEMIAQFVLSLPKSIRQNSEEPVPEHIQRMFDEANTGQYDHHHHHHDHDNEHAAGYMNMYGPSQEWGS